MIVRGYWGKNGDGVSLYRIYSDENLIVRQRETGKEYAEAIDLDGATYTYEETETPVDVEYDEIADMKTALGILIGKEGSA